MKFLILLILISFFNCSSPKKNTKKDVAFPVKKGCVSGNCTDGLGTLEYENGEKYIGEFKNSLPDGNGRLQYKNNHVYSGEFNAGKPHGYGTLYDENKNVIYTGNWEKGKY